jgi:hypothetical protein
LILGNPDLRPKLVKFLSLTAGKLADQQSFQEAFGLDYEQMEARLRAFVLGNKFPMLACKISAEAYAGLGRTYLYDPDDVQTGIALLQEADSRLPGRDDLPYELMLLYLRAGDRATAESLATRGPAPEGD